MNKITLRPIVHKDAHTRLLESEAVLWLREALFTSLALAVEGQRHNIAAEPAPSAVVAALLAGTLHYSDGYFTGKLGSAIGKELHMYGATFDRKRVAYHLPQLPPFMYAAVTEAQQASRTAHEDVLAALAAAALALGTAETGIPYQQTAGRVLTDLDHQFRESVEGRDLDAHLLGGAERKPLIDAYAENTEAALRGMVAERLPILRREVLINLEKGGSAARLSALLEREFKNQQAAAARISEHQTAQLIADYRETRYTLVGITEYRWVDRDDEKVRPDHKALRHQCFRFDSPPITNRATGARNNPGEDYNCRCTAAPVLALIEA